MKKRLRFLACLILCFTFSFYFLSTNTKAENTVQWKITKSVKNKNTILSAMPESLPKGTNAIEIGLTFPTGTKIQSITPVFENSDHTKPDSFFTQTDSKDSVMVTVYCVNKLNQFFTANKPLFQITMDSSVTVTQNNLKINYVTAVDENLLKTRFDSITLQLVNDSSGDNSDNSGGGGGGGGGGGFVPDISEDKEDTADQEDKTIESKTTSSTNKKTGVTTKKIVVTDKENRTVLSVNVQIDKTGKVSASSAKLQLDESAVKAAKTANSFTITIPDTSWLTSLKEVQKEYKVTDKTSIQVILPGKTLIKALESNGKSAALKVTVPSWFSAEDNLTLNRVVLKKDVLNTAKNNKKSLDITVARKDTGISYTWNLKADAFTKTSKSFTNMNLLLDMTPATKSKAVKKALTANNKAFNGKGVLLQFDENTTLAFQAGLTITPGKSNGFKADQSVYLYRFNQEKGKLEALPDGNTYRLDNNKITLQLTSLNTYVLLNKEADDSCVLSIPEQITTPEKISVALNKSASLPLTLPNFLYRSKKITSEVPGSAYGAVVITHTSSRPEIASISKTGKITGKKAGKTIITTTVKLYDNKVLTLNTTVTVK